MKAINWILSLILVGALLALFAGCQEDHTADLQMEINQLEQEVQAEISRIDERVTKLNREMENVGEETGEEVRIKLSEQIDNLGALRNELWGELQKLPDATQDQIGTIRADFEDLRMRVDEALIKEIPRNADTTNVEEAQ